MTKFLTINVGIFAFLYLCGLFITYDSIWFAMNHGVRIFVVIMVISVTCMQYILWEDLKAVIWGKKK